MLNYPGYRENRWIHEKNSRKEKDFSQEFYHTRNYPESDFILFVVSAITDEWSRDY